MASVRSGKRGVLLVVDVQVDVMKNAWDSARVLANVRRAVERARAAGAPVVWVQQTDDEFVRGGAGWQLAEGLAPAPGEARIEKAFNSAFEETALEAELARLGATHLVLCGAATNWCLRATAHGAIERGYDLTLLKDAHTTESMDLENGTVVEAARIVDEFNVAMTWMQYPGRVNATAGVEEVDFDAVRGARPAG